MLGGSGSLLLRTDVRGLAAHVEPFVIGDLDPQRSFVHVFDDATLDFVMSTLDTTPDFIRYLREKERLCRSRTVYVAGEENLLAHYLTHVADDGEHALVFDPEPDMIGIDDSWWEHFRASPEREAQLRHDRVSYAWDRLIEQFTQHAFTGTQYFATEPPLESTEIVLRIMAAESRFRRRSLSEALLEAIETTAPNQRRIRVIPSQRDSEPMYVFLLFPWFDEKPDAENRTVRRNFLEACIYVARMKYGQAVDVVGLATESGENHDRRSEDALYLDGRDWNAEDEELARTHQRDLGILVDERMLSKHVLEYPVHESPASTRSTPKNPRDKQCPCGSGRKYKFCHGR
jgi:SEC-C motif